MPKRLFIIQLRSTEGPVGKCPWLSDIQTFSGLAEAKCVAVMELKPGVDVRIIKRKGTVVKDYSR